MAKKQKLPEFTHCKVTLTTHPSAPWRVSYPVEENGITRRKRRMFSTDQKAIAFATEHEKEVADHGVRFGSITAAARRAYDFYRDARHDLRAEGIDPPTFEELVMAAVSNLRKEHADRQRNKKTVAEGVEEFLNYKRPRVGPGRLSGLKGHLTRFAGHFGTVPIDRMTGGEIESWLFTLRPVRSGDAIKAPPLDPVTRNKMRKDLKELFTYGLDPERGWCNRNPLANIKSESVMDKPPRAYSVEDSSAILQAALELKSPALPSIVLGLFAGLRPSETMAIDLAAVHLDKDQFRVPEVKPDGTRTKTGSRMATLTPAGAVWLATQKRRTGKAWPLGWEKLTAEINRVLAFAKVGKIFDGFRHSFITYRTAETRDVARVGDECGNSPNVIKKHYREIVTGEAAARYFAIRPVKPAANVTSIEEGRASA